MYVYMYVCVCVCVHVYAYIYIYIKPARGFKSVTDKGESRITQSARCKRHVPQLWQVDGSRTNFLSDMSSYVNMWHL